MVAHSSFHYGKSQALIPQRDQVQPLKCFCGHFKVGAWKSLNRYENLAAKNEEGAYIYVS